MIRCKYCEVSFEQCTCGVSECAQSYHMNECSSPQGIAFRRKKAFHCLVKEFRETKDNKIYEDLKTNYRDLLDEYAEFMKKELKRANVSGNDRM